jgi:hypothetical protein
MLLAACTAAPVGFTPVPKKPIPSKERLAFPFQDQTLLEDWGARYGSACCRGSFCHPSSAVCLKDSLEGTNRNHNDSAVKFAGTEDKRRVLCGFTIQNGDAGDDRGRNRCDAIRPAKDFVKKPFNNSPKEGRTTMYKQILAAIIAAATYGISSNACWASLNANLLFNPGFESNLDGWTTDHGAIRKASPLPHDGVNYLIGSMDNSSLSYTYQTMDLIGAGFDPDDLDAGYLEVYFGGWQAGYQTQTDSGKIEIIVTDGTNELLRSDLGWFYSNSTWVLKEGAVALPQGARFITYGFHSQRFQGSNNDGYLDDTFVELRTSQAPATIVAITRAGDSVTLRLADLCVGASYVVFRTPDLECDCWTQRDTFIAESVVMDWSETVEEGLRQSFYRILTEGGSAAASKFGGESLRLMAGALDSAVWRN